MAGWFPTPRDLLSDDLWLSEKFTRGQARIDLYGLARHTPGHVRHKGVRIDLERGELAWSEQGLAHRWQWSRGKVRRFLAELAAERLIVQRPSNLTSIITIINYDGQPTSGTAVGTNSDTADSTANSTANGTANGTQKKKETIQQGNNLSMVDVDHARMKWTESEIGEARWLISHMATKLGSRSSRKSENRSLLIKTAVLKMKRYGDNWLQDALKGTLAKKGKCNRFSYLHTCLSEQTAKVGGNFNQDLKRLDGIIPEALLTVFDELEPAASRLCEVGEL